jgi:hypothetical protein
MIRHTRRWLIMAAFLGAAATVAIAWPRQSGATTIGAGQIQIQPPSPLQAQPARLPGAPAVQSAAQAAPSAPAGSCAVGTDDLGLHDGYVGGRRAQIRLCALPGLLSTGQESRPGSPYYIAGANGRAIVNARVSRAWRDLASAAKAAGVPLSASSSFRTMKHQQALYAAQSNAARPGYSNHQLGLAIDFSFYTQTKSPGYQWLHKHAAEWGMHQLSSEPWHWSPDGR